MTFHVIADVQYGDKPSEEPRRYRDALVRLKESVEHCRRTSPSFAVQLGDLIDGGPNALQEMKRALSVLEGIGPTELVHVLGNHDFHGLDRGTVPALLGIESGTFDFVKDGRRFIVLDTVELSMQGGWDEQSRNYQAALEMIDSLKKSGADNARKVNGGMSREQIDWLDDVLSDADSNKQPAVVFGHLPLLPHGEKHTLYNSEEVTGVLEGHPCVKVYLSGHRHAGGDEESGGIHYVGMEAMVESAGSGGWADIVLEEKTMEIRGTGNVRSRMLKLR